jgi:hypothetical protein
LFDLLLVVGNAVVRTYNLIPVSSRKEVKATLTDPIPYTPYCLYIQYCSCGLLQFNTAKRICSFIHPFNHLHSFIHHSPSIHSSIHSFIHSSIHLFIHPSTFAIRSSIHSFITVAHSKSNGRPSSDETLTTTPRSTLVKLPGHRGHAHSMLREQDRKASRYNSYSFVRQVDGRACFNLTNAPADEVLWNSTGLLNMLVGLGLVCVMNAHCAGPPSSAQPTLACSILEVLKLAPFTQASKVPSSAPSLLPLLLVISYFVL